MFHRVPFIFPTSVVTAAVILVLAALFALSLSSPGTAHASHSSPPTVSILSITPEVGEEGRNLRVTLQLSRPLTEDEKYCYPGNRAGEEPRNEVCIEGGLVIMDNYNDHLYEGGHIPSDSGIKFVFRGNQVEDRLSVRIVEDECITPNRQIVVWIHRVYEDRDEYPDETKYGYHIDRTEHTVRVIGDDETNGTLVDDEGKCLPVEEGATEEIVANYAPSFSGRDKTFSVREDADADEDIGSPVTATDPDEDDTLEYSLTGTDAASFDIDYSTGQLMMTDTELDYETKDTYHLAVSVSDGMNIYGDSDSAEDDSIDVTINVTNVNEAPEFDSNAPTELNVVENTAADVDIGSPVTAIDPEGDTVTYSLDDGDGAAFEIDDTSGQIKTKDALDRETKDSYTVTVTTSDDGGANATHVVTITVGNEVEPPTFDEEPEQGQSNISRSIPENTLAGRPIGDPVSATDEESNPLTYSLDDQDGAAFDIDSGTGQIKTKDPLDHETKASYTIEMSVSDGKDADGNTEDTPTPDATITVTINVTDVNEKPQFAEDAVNTLEVAENTADGENIGSPFTATDPDNAHTLTYSLGGDDAASFGIDESSGQIKTKTALDYETKDSYTVIVSVRDGRDDTSTTDTAEDDSIEVTITINNVDEGGVVALSSQHPRTGAPLTATLEDPDGEASAVAWKWESSTDRNNWTEITGATAGSYTPVQTDEGSYLQVTATYTDAVFGADKEAQTDTDNAVPANNPPAFTAETDSRSIPENTPAGRNIGTPITATDTDTDDTLTYSLEVWPESHWPGFALREADVFKSYMAW